MEHTEHKGFFLIQGWWSILMAANSWDALFLFVSEITPPRMSCLSETNGALQNFNSKTLFWAIKKREIIQDNFYF